MHYLSRIYFVTQALHVSGTFTAHQQEVFTLYVQQLVRDIRFGDWQQYIYSEYLLIMDSSSARNM
jgi:hypothetical protein